MQPKHEWTLLTSHGMVLFHVAANPNVTQRELSDVLGITERQISRIIQDLAAANLLQIQHHGRRNIYIVNPNAHFRHPTLAHIPLHHIIKALVPELVSSAAAPAERNTAEGSFDERAIP